MGRFKRLPPEERVCALCKVGSDFIEESTYHDRSVEDSYHFVLVCPVYNVERDVMLKNVSLPGNYSNFTKIDKLKCLLELRLF